MIIRTV